MKWTELKPDAAPGGLAEALRGMDCGSAIRVHINLHRGTRLYIVADCAARVASHVRSDHNEVGGLLVGRVLENRQSRGTGAEPIVLVVESVASKVYRNSPVSLEMSTEIWNRVISNRNDHFVVGWYHSHPNLGAFFSGTDRRTQQSFFYHRYSVGWVIDPCRDEQKVFVGRDAEEYPGRFVVLNADSEIAKNL